VRRNKPEGRFVYPKLLREMPQNNAQCWAGFPISPKHRFFAGAFRQVSSLFAPKISPLNTPSLEKGIPRSAPHFCGAAH
jgi:hypothetical protein